MPSRPPTHRAPRPPGGDGRPSAWKRGYGYKWQRVRRRILARDPICTRCGKEPSKHVDHVVALAKGGTNDDGNLVGLCASCHSKKTVAQDGGFGRPKT